MATFQGSRFTGHKTEKKEKGSGEASEYVMSHGTSQISKRSSYHTTCNRGNCNHNSGPHQTLSDARHAAKEHEYSHNPFSVVTHINGKKIK